MPSSTLHSLGTHYPPQSQEQTPSSSWHRTLLSGKSFNPSACRAPAPQSYRMANLTLNRGSRFASFSASPYPFRLSLLERPGIGEFSGMIARAWNA